MFGIMAKTQGTRAFMFWIVTFGMIYITGMTLSCVSGYYLPLDLCDFYFEGHRECAPMFDAISTKLNITFPASILTKDYMTVSTAQVNPKCAFLADPSRVFGLDEECSGHFHLRDKKLFGQFSVFKSHQSHQILLKFEIFAKLATPILAAVRDLVQRVVLQDGTVLTPSDGSIHFLESKRCVTIFTAPACENWQDWKEDNLSYENLEDCKIAVRSEQISQTRVTIVMTHKCMMVGLCGTCYVTGNGNPSLETSWSIRRLDLDVVTDGPLYAQQRAPQEAQEAKQKSETSAQ